MDQDFYSNNGYVRLEEVALEDITTLDKIYTRFLESHYDLTGYRVDLSGENTAVGKEKITQIMRPSLIAPELQKLAVYERLLKTSRVLEGEDMDMDFDMMINKLPQSNTPTPWHQDAAYWLELSDRRSISFWIAIDPVDKENGCMMYIPKSHTMDLLPHARTNEKGALECKIPSDSKIDYGILPAGSAIGHHGFTLHGALGNTSNTSQRRALILNFRPKAVIEDFRKKGFNHLP